jgi:uncharacterized membrane protein
MFRNRWSQYSGSSGVAPASHSLAASSRPVRYSVFKWMHILGVIILLGNVTVTAVWKVFADRTANPTVIAFAQRLVTITDWSLTLLGIALLMIGGFGALAITGMNPFATGWLRIGEALFVLSGGIWACILLPTQVRQARAARAFASDGIVTEPYRRDARRWILWGIIATVPLVVATWVMVVKPV